MALKVEGVVNRSVNAEETLGRSRRLEPLQFALPSSDCLMRILRPIILSEPLLMRTGQTETAQRRSVGAQFVGDQQFRRETLLLSSLRISRNAGRVLRRRWISMSRTSPSWSTARQRYIRSPAMRTTRRVARGSCIPALSQNRT